MQVRDTLTGKRVLLHRQLVSSFLGRPLLPGEVVHHRDGNPRNNARENLLVLPSQQYHAHIEQLLRRERRGQSLLFPEYLQAVRQRHGGSLFENILCLSAPLSGRIEPHRVRST